MSQQISILDFYNHFSDEQSCQDYLARMRWGKHPICPHCKSSKIPYITKIGYKCSNNKCYKKFTVTVGTIFESSNKPLQLWFYIIFNHAINKKNISSHQLSKNFGTTQTTAWKMSHKLRTTFWQDDSILLSGTIEVDEAFLSKGGTKWTRWGGVSTRKAPILGLIERGTGRLIIKEIEDRKRTTILKLINKYVEKGSIIYTDGASLYKTLKENYTHEFVNHSEREYVRGNVHTNNIEGIWRMLKSNIRHAHHSVSSKHVQLYCNELCYRRNTKHLSATEIFDDILLRCINYKN